MSSSLAYGRKLRTPSPSFLYSFNFVFVLRLSGVRIHRTLRVRLARLPDADRAKYGLLSVARQRY